MESRVRYDRAHIHTGGYTVQNGITKNGQVVFIGVLTCGRKGEGQLSGSFMGAYMCAQL